MNEQDWNRVEVMIIKAVDAAVTKTVPEAVNKTVNGKIDRLNNKLDPEHEDYILKETDEHIMKMKPLVEGLTGAKFLGDILKWLAGLAAAWIVVKSFLKGEI